MLGGEVIPPKQAISILSDIHDLQPYLQLWTVPGSNGVRTKEVDEDLKKDLLKLLLEVYMSDMCGLAPFVPLEPSILISEKPREPSADRAAQLLDSQAINLDIIDVSLRAPLLMRTEIMTDRFLHWSHRVGP